MLYTGGTTGTPKLAIRSHLNEVCVPFIANLYNKTLNRDETVLACTPLFHALAPFTSGTFAFSVGGHVVVLTPLGFKDSSVVRNIYKIIEYYRAVCLFLVPTMLLMLLDPPLEGTDISSFRWVNCGGSPLSQAIIRRWEAKTNVKIVQGYGLTEATSITSMDPMDGERRIGSIGLRMPYVQQEVFVLDERGGFLRHADPNEIGTICIKGPTVMKGYMDPGHNSRAWAKEGWLNTGDLGRRDSDGYFWLTGRSKEVIRRSGHNIDPAIIEDSIYRLEGVRVAAAVAKPDPYAGEVPCLYVQLKEGSHLTKEKIMDYMKEHIGERFATPKEIIIVDDMPLTGVGKIFKPALYWDAVKRTYEADLSVLEDRVEFYRVDVREDRVTGILATVTVKPVAGTAREHIEKRVKEVLAPYSVPYRVEVI
jgi:fatty-acyl-CoA synthase